MAGQLHRLDVDHSEHQAALLNVVRRDGGFDVRMVRLTTGDYLIDEEALIERKTIAAAPRFAAALCAPRPARRRSSARSATLGPVRLRGKPQGAPSDRTES